MYNNGSANFSADFDLACPVTPRTKWAFGFNRYASKKRPLSSWPCASASVPLHIKRPNTTTSKFQIPSDCTFHGPFTGWPQEGMESEYLKSIFTNSVWISSHLFIRCQEVAAHIIACRTAPTHRFLGKSQISRRKGGDTGKAAEVWLEMSRRQ